MNLNSVLNILYISTIICLGIVSTFSIIGLFKFIRNRKTLTKNYEYFKKNNIQFIVFFSDSYEYINIFNKIRFGNEVYMINIDEVQDKKQGKKTNIALKTFLELQNTNLDDFIKYKKNPSIYSIETFEELDLYKYLPILELSLIQNKVDKFIKFNK